ncbi:MAG: ABC transporter permease [Desulfurococcales archaeon]|nr:ABC transporter permease [Desulfurococcales archaeon]
MGSLNRILSEAYVGVKGIFRYKEVLFWVILFPILFYGLMIGIWGNTSYNPIKAGIYDPDNGVVLENGTRLDLSDALKTAMNESKVFKIYIYDNETKLIESVKRGGVDVGLIIPGNFTESLLNMTPATIRLVTLKTPWGDYNREATIGFLNGFADGIRERYLNMTMKFAVQYVPEEYKAYLGNWFNFLRKPLTVNETLYTPPLLETPEGVRAFYAIGMIGVEILFIGLSTGTSSIIDMKKEGTLRIILSSPIRKWELLASLTLSTLIAVAISSLSIILFSLALGASYNISLQAAIAIIALLALGALFTIGLGLLLAPLARSQEAAMVIVNAIAFPIMFIGGIVIPKFILPESLQVVADVYPLSREIEAIRRMTLYNYTPGEALAMAWPAIAGTIIVYAIGLAIFNKLLARAAEE